MYDFESILLNAARIGLEPVRSIIRARQERIGKSPISVLFYHRVADVHSNSWTISCSQFLSQMEWLVRNYEVISLDECQERIASGRNERPSVAITFDDGYAENLEFAIPWLMERSIPLTYFVTLGNILSGEPFPHDVAAGQPLAVNTAESIRGMANCGVTIGAHTRTHPNLAEINDPNTLFDEIVTATRELGELIGQPIEHFAFPFGTEQAVSRRAAELARKAGIRCICSANNGVNFPGDDPFHIARIHGDPLLARVRNWLSAPTRLHSNRTAIDQILADNSQEPIRSSKFTTPVPATHEPSTCQNTNCDCHAV
jgi:peptidoglycan/xylan/chitin deacetylase (PgdA/CDA1 family)